MDRVTGIRFREGGKIYHFNPGELELKIGDYVIVHTEQGMGFGQVVQGPRVRDAQVHPSTLKKVQRLATEEEIQRARDNAFQEKTAKQYCMECIHRLGLVMNLVDVEYHYDGSKIIFYFTADGRVDFRELVKDLVRHFKTRVELRQIGVRNQARMVGGLGTCGRELCCASFLREFQPVSVKMAKEQNLSLNPTKISGSCGRLMCCLKYEYDTYKALKKDMPKLGKKIETADGRGKVIRQNVLERTYTVLLESGKELEVKLPPLEVSAPKQS